MTEQTQGKQAVLRTSTEKSIPIIKNEQTNTNFEISSMSSLMPQLFGIVKQQLPQHYPNLSVIPKAKQVDEKYFTSI